MKGDEDFFLGETERDWRCFREISEISGGWCPHIKLLVGVYVQIMQEMVLIASRTRGSAIREGLKARDGQ